MVPKRAVALATAALALAGCGSEEEDPAQREAVERVIQRFAQADGPDACELLSPDALRQVYGGPKDRFGYENCERRSKEFEGERVNIEDVDLKGKTRAFVRAESPDETRRYRIGVEKFGPSWLIDSISLEDVE